MEFSKWPAPTPAQGHQLLPFQLQRDEVVYGVLAVGCTQHVSQAGL